MLTVAIPDLDPLVTILGQAGSKISWNAGQQYLVGPCVITFGGSFTTEQIDFHVSDRVIVIQDASGNNILQSAAPGSFIYFPDGEHLLVQQTGGAWLEAEGFVFSRDPDTGTFIDFTTVNVSLGQGGQYDNGGVLDSRAFLWYPTAAGFQQQKLDGSTAPNQNTPGHYLCKSPIGFEIVSGGPASPVTLDHRESVRLTLTQDCQIRFWAFRPDGTLVSSDSASLVVNCEADAAIQVAVPVSTRLQLPIPLANGFSALNLKGFTVQGPWINSTAIDPAGITGSTVTLTRLPSTGPVADSPTRLYSDPGNLQFEIPSDQDAAKLPQFVYQDPSVLGAPAFSPYDGLRIQGLGWSKGDSQARLDASLLTVTLWPGPAPANTPTFQFEAGSVSGSFLVPKPDRARNGARTLQIPAGDLWLECSFAPSDRVSPLSLDTSSTAGQLKLPGAILLGPPLGAVSGDGVGSGVSEYKYWTLQRPLGNPLAFDLSDNGIAPSEGQAWPTPFVSVGAGFPLLEHPGAAVGLDNPSGLRTASASPRTTLASMTTTNAGQQAEVVAYSTINLQLSYAPILPNSGSLGDFVPLDRILCSWDLGQLGTDVKSNATNDLIVLFHSPATSPDANFTAFIDMQNPQLPAGTPLILPLSRGMGILLKDKTGSYAPAIALARSLTEPAIGFDLSSMSSISPPDFGSQATSWTDFAKSEPPVLWPRVLRPANPGSRLDPSDPNWRGIFFYDLPLDFTLDPSVDSTSYPVLTNLFTQLGSTLGLEYGWLDESGPTWKSILPNGLTIPVTDNTWAPYFILILTNFLTMGAAGDVVQASGTMDITLPLITSASDSTAFKATADFYLNLTGGEIVDKIDLLFTDSQSLTSRSIPGFQEIEVNEISTDLKTAQISFTLTPDPALTAVLPFLNGGIEATAALNLGGPANFDISFLLPAGLQTKLYGIFLMSVEGMGVSFGASTTLTVRCRLNFGMSGFISVGATIKLIQVPNSGNWTMSLTVDEVGGSLDIPGFGATVSLQWTDSMNVGKSLPLAKAHIADGTTREFIGTLQLQNSSGFLDGLSMVVRIGASGESTFWVAAASPGDFGLGPCSLKSFALVLARNADCNGALLSNFLDSLATGDFQQQALRPDPNNLNAYLQTWAPSSRVSTVLGGSAGFGIHPMILGTPDITAPQNLTTLVFTNTGYVSIDAVSSFFGSPFLLRYSISLGNGMLTASMGLPNPIDFPPGSSELSIQTGQLVLSVTYLGTFSAGISVGWPPPSVDGDPLDRDWSKSVMVHWDDMFPINTLWGGFQSQYSSGGLVEVGWAMRVGWTKVFNFGGDLAGVSAELGVAIGGVIQFAYAWGSSTPVMVRHSNPLLEHVTSDPWRVPVAFRKGGALNPGESIQWLALGHAVQGWQIEIESILTGYCQGVSYEVDFYADVWGSASATVFGISVASISISARAALSACGNSNSLVAQLVGRVSFSFEVRIGCVTMTANASLDVVIIDNGSCTCNTFRQPYMIPEGMVAA